MATFAEAGPGPGPDPGAQCGVLLGRVAGSRRSWLVPVPRRRPEVALQCDEARQRFNEHQIFHAVPPFSGVDLRTHATSRERSAISAAGRRWSMFFWSSGRYGTCARTPRTS